MRTRKLVLAIGLAGVLGSGSAARAQWMRLQRCEGALPCALPFGIRYAPDPLIASQYGFVSPNGLSGRIAFEPGPVLHIDEPHVALELPDFASQAARRFLLAHPPPAPTAVPDKVEPPPKPTPRSG
jgi:hypothetical protein